MSPMNVLLCTKFEKLLFDKTTLNIRIRPKKKHLCYSLLSCKCSWGCKSPKAVTLQPGFDNEVGTAVVVTWTVKLKAWTSGYKVTALFESFYTRNFLFTYTYMLLLAVWRKVTVIIRLSILSNFYSIRHKWFISYYALKKKKRHYLVIRSYRFSQFNTRRFDVSPCTLTISFTVFYPKYIVTYIKK
ncbi:hypothetical protein BDC45DRAFT_534413 [Circinella umbellata]|nr:hypothetical protein BDC45DRAFT_534413 [Circinella umbellata]